MYKCSHCDKIGLKQTITKCEKKHEAEKKAAVELKEFNDKVISFRETIGNEVTSLAELLFRASELSKEISPDYHFNITSQSVRGVIDNSEFKGFHCDFSFTIYQKPNWHASSNKHPFKHLWGSDIIKQFIKFHVVSGGGGGSLYTYNCKISFNDYPLMHSNYLAAVNSANEINAASKVYEEKMAEVVKNDEIVKSFDSAIRDLEQQLSSIRSQVNEAKNARHRYLADIQSPLHEEFTLIVKEHSGVLDRSPVYVDYNAPKMITA